MCGFDRVRGEGSHGCHLCLESFVAVVSPCKLWDIGVGPYDLIVNAGYVNTQNAQFNESIMV